MIKMDHQKRRLSELCQGFHQLGTKRVLGFPLPSTWSILQGLFINSPTSHSRPHMVLKLGCKHKSQTLLSSGNAQSNWRN